MSYDERSSILLRDELTDTRQSGAIRQQGAPAVFLPPPPPPLLPVERVGARCGYYAARRITFCRLSAATSTGSSQVSSLLDNPDLSPRRIGSRLLVTWPTTGFLWSICVLQRPLNIRRWARWIWYIHSLATVINRKDLHSAAIRL